MKSVKSKIFKRSVWALISGFFAISFVILLVAQQVVIPYENWIDRYFGVSRTILVNDEGAEETDTEYYKSKYAIDDEGSRQARDWALDVAERVNEEGSVLLWNKSNALPLAENTKVSTYGVMAHKWLYHGTGSAEVDLKNTSKSSLVDALQGRKLSVNGKVMDATWYYLDSNYGTFFDGHVPMEVSWSDLSSYKSGSAIDATKNEYDTVIYTIGRTAGEGQTLDSNELSLSANEASVLKGLSDLRNANQIKKLIVVLNVANALNVGAFKNYNIDACLWVGYGGNTSCDALADLLVGNANPSGRLTDAWVYDVNSSPASVNYGDFCYVNGDTIPNNPDQGEANNSYVVYQEGIYVGYLYYETRYEDVVLGNGNATSSKGVVAGSGSWNYTKEVAYTFGHGESYTTFEYSDYSVTRNGSNYEVSMKITNTGSVPGKEVMQVYLQKPYTEYDKTTGIEKASVQLVGYAKTKLLAPKGQENSSQTLTVTVPEYEFKTYDSYGEKTYILEKGDYYLAAGSDAHNAVNNILNAKGKTQSDGMDEAGDGKLVQKVTVNSNDFKTYSVAPSGTAKVTNRFDNADVNLYEGTGSQKIKYLSRNNWDDTYPVSAVSLEANETIIAALKYVQQVPNNADDVMPQYVTVTSEYGKLNLIQLKDLAYDDPLWDDLLNQMSFSEQLELVKHCLTAATSINMPDGKAYDGPCGLRDMTNPYVDNTRMAFPCNPIVASTFNDELVEELGEAFGEEMMHCGVTGLWGLGANIHRLASSGRNWEYYSEDGYLSGKILAAETKGLLSKGIIVYTKHIALNDQEKNRVGISTWANEQTIREIYLKAFEASVTEADGNGFMTSYNRIGCTWSGQHAGLLTDVIRNEWGFKGLTITDWCDKDLMGYSESSIIATGIMAGQDEWLFNILGTGMLKYANNATFCQALRDSAHRNLYTRLHSNVMNGIGANTRVELVTPAWQNALQTVTIVSGVFMGGCLVMTALSWVFWYFDRRGTSVKA